MKNFDKQLTSDQNHYKRMLIAIRFYVLHRLVYMLIVNIKII